MVDIDAVAVVYAVTRCAGMADAIALMGDVANAVALLDDLPAG